MDNEEIGKQIVGLRKKHQLTQRELAQKAGITHSAISSIENNKVSPSVSSLQKIVNVFSLSLSEFFTLGNEDIPENKVILSKDELVEMGSDQVSMRLICNGTMKRKMGFLIEEYQPHSTTGEAEIQHEGEEAGTILSGEIQLNYGNKVYVIKEGESYLIDTTIPHKFTNTTDKVCKIISAHTPATF